MKTQILTRLLAVLFFIGIASASQAITITSEPIVSNPASTENLWSYSYLDYYANISSANYYVTSSSEYASAVHQGYVTGISTTSPHATSDFFNITQQQSDSRTMHVFDTYIMSSIDQTLSFSIGGDDGHSFFSDNVFLAGGGYYDGSVQTSIDLLANTQYHLTLVGVNRSGPWSFFVNTNGSRLSDVSNISMNATGNFAPAPVPEPATMLLFGLGLLGLSGISRKRKP